MFLVSIIPTPLSKAITSSVCPSNKCCPALSAVRALYSSKQLLELMLILDIISKTYETSMSGADKSSGWISAHERPQKLIKTCVCVCWYLCISLYRCIDVYSIVYLYYYILLIVLPQKCYKQIVWLNFAPSRRKQCWDRRRQWRDPLGELEWPKRKQG